MPIVTTKLGLLKPTTLDPFSTKVLAGNWQTVDDSPGAFICTSTTRPGSGTSVAWSVNQAGREIMETDTELKWRFDGVTFKRVNSTGVLKTDIGAAAWVSSPMLSITSPIPVEACRISNVVVPDGNRLLMITCSWVQASSTSGRMIGNILCSGSIDPSRTWTMEGNSTSGSYLAYIRGGLPASKYNFSVQLSDAAGGGSTFAAHSFDLTVVEL